MKGFQSECARNLWYEMKTPLRILMVALHLDHRLHGGLSRHTYELCKALDKLGCQIYVSCMNNDLMNINNKVSVPSFHIHEPTLDFISFNINLPRKTHGYDVDIIHSQEDNGFIFGLIKKRPLVVTTHGSMKIVSPIRYHPSTHLRHLTKRFVIREANKIIAVSKSVGKAIQNNFGIDEKKIVYIPNAVDVERFNPTVDGELVRKKYNIDGPLLVSVSRLDPGRFVEKLFPMMKAVKKEIPNVKLIIVGNGQSKRFLEMSCARSGLTKDVIFVGAKGDDELPYFYAAADLYVLPMVFIPARKEFSVLEALATARTVVYVNRLGPEDKEERITRSNPISTNNDKDFASSIISLLQNEKKRKELGSIARKTVLRYFSWEKVAEKTIEVYKSLI